MDIVLSAAAVAVLGACSAQRGDEPISEPPPTHAPSIHTPSADAKAKEPAHGPPAFARNTARQMAKHSGEWGLVFRDVHVGQHEGFDRIVLEFIGTGVPGWVVNYVDEAALDGSGRVVKLGGDAVLDIYASGTTWPASGYYSGPRQFVPENGGGIDEVYVGGTFEGYTQVLLGINGIRVPFRVFALADPSRLVVDVVDDSD